MWFSCLAEGIKKDFTSKWAVQICSVVNTTDCTWINNNTEKPMVHFVNWDYNQASSKHINFGKRLANWLICMFNAEEKMRA